LSTTPAQSPEAIWTELFASLASLLRSYTGMHGLSGGRMAKIAASEQVVVARHGKKWLRLERIHGSITWTRDNGRNGTLEFTEHGHLRGPEGEEAMDLAAEGWARELMQ